jgi:fatty acid desaturase
MRTTFPAIELLTEAQIAQVRGRSNLRGVWLVAHAWCSIAASAALFVWLPNPATFVLAAMVIGSRQLGLLILMHDGAHGLLCRNRRLNDLLSQFCCALPTFADTFTYRRYHLKHHARTLHEDDPDLVLTGHYPITRASLRRKLLRDLSGRTGLSQRHAQFSAAAGRQGDPAAMRLRQFVRSLGPHLLVNALLFGAAIAAGHWIVYPLLWVLPLLTWQQLVLRVRNIAEHAVVRDRDDPFGNARTTTANLLERLFVAPYWVNYHLEHHLMMWVPCYRLPMLRRFLLANGYGERMLSADGYLKVLARVTVDTNEESGSGRRERAMGTFSDGFGA